MPLLDIAIAQPSILSYMRSPRVQTSANNRVLSSNFTRRDGNRLVSLWKSLQIQENANFTVGGVKTSHGKLVVRAVATLQPKRLLQNEDVKKDYRSFPSTPEPVTPELNVESPNEDTEEINEREKLRRQRISKANKGNTPWNKGRKHSPETLQRIRERTRLAMQNPKVKMKLANLGHAQSKETRRKIGIGVQMGWRRRRERLLVQETCFFNWQNLVAETARQGFVEEEELQWDSYEKLDQQLQQEWLEGVELRKTMSKPKGSKRAPKSLEQRRKIAASIAAKWADPEYRDRVYSGLARYHGSPVGVERKRRRLTGEGQSRRRSSKKEVSDGDIYAKTLERSSFRQPKPKKSKGPVYKDPLAKAKLEMIKSIRARRASSHMKKHEAVERAKSLITEAEKAAEALEAAAASSPIAQASLIETRKLIAEAVQLIQSIENEQSTPVENSKMHIPIEHGDGTTKQNGLVEANQIAQLHQLPLNGIHNLEKINGDVEDLDFPKLPFKDSTNVKKEHSNQNTTVIDTYENSALGIDNVVSEPKFRDTIDLPENNGFVIKVNGTPESEVNINGRGIKINGSAKQNGIMLQATNPREEISSIAVTKRWVRGRLIEVVEGE